MTSELENISHGKNLDTTALYIHIQMSIFLALCVNSASTYTFTSMQTYHLNNLANCKKSEYYMLSQKKDKEKLLNEVICRWILLYYLLKYKFQDKVQ